MFYDEWAGKEREEKEEEDKVWWEAQTSVFLTHESFWLCKKKSPNNENKGSDFKIGWSYQDVRNRI